MAVTKHGFTDCEMRAGDGVKQADQKMAVAHILACLRKAGFTVAEVKYMGMGRSPNQSLLKRLAKLLAQKTLMRTRMFSSTHYFVAIRSEQPV
jgi:hypothetical protein